MLFIFHSAYGLMKYKCTREIQNLWMLILRYIQLQIMHYINNINITFLSYYIVLYYIIYYIILYYIILYYIILYYIILYYIISHHIILYHIISYKTDLQYDNVIYLFYIQIIQSVLKIHPTRCIFSSPPYNTSDSPFPMI